MSYPSRPLRRRNRDRRRSLLRCLLLASLAPALLCWSSNSKGQEPKENSSKTVRSLAIRGGRLFEGTDRDAIENSTILILENRITRVGKETEIPENTQIIDADGLTILPGLIDLHLHFGAPAGDDFKLSETERMKGYIAQRPDVRRALLEAGVTSFRSVGDVVGNRWWGIIGLQHSIQQGKHEGPRLYSVGPIFTAPQGHPAGTIYKGNSFLIEQATRQVTDPMKARQEVEYLAALGVKGIKAVYDGGNPNRPLPRLSLDVLRAIIAEAHKQNLWVAVHAGSNEEVRDAVAAGADTIEHGTGSRSPLDETTIALMKQHEVTLVPTLAVYDSLGGQEQSPQMTRRLQNVKAAFDAGIPIGAGTDTQGRKMSFRTSMQRELELLVKAGLTPKQAILTATRNAARALKAQADLGTIEAGKLADLVLVKGNPLQNISEISQVRLVIQNGRIVADLRM